VLMRFSAKQKCLVAAERFTAAFRGAGRAAEQNSSRVMLTLDQDPATGGLQVLTYRYYYKADLIDSKAEAYHAKNYPFALGDMQGETDGTKRPVPLQVTPLPPGVMVEEGAWPGQAGHCDPAARKYVFVYPDPSGEYRATNPPVLLYNSMAEDPRDALIPADPSLFGGDPSDPNHRVTYWIDINPDRTVDDGSSNDSIPVKFIDQVTGEWAQVEILKATRTARITGASEEAPAIPHERAVMAVFLCAAGLAVLYFLIILAIGILRRVRDETT
jgi:hypothetical protein